MSKQSKARDEAFRAAAENLAKGQGYDVNLTPARLEQWIKVEMEQQQEEWQLIWDAARTWTVQNWRAKVKGLEAELNAARNSAGEVHSLLAAAEQTNVALREELVQLKRDYVDVTTRKVAQSTSQALNERIEEVEALKAELEETRKHTTSATWKVFQENESLVAEVHRLTSLLADREEELARRTTPWGTRPCTDVLGQHRCVAMTYPDRRHPQRHSCHCGTVWN